MNYGSDYKHIPVTSVGDGIGIEVLPDIFSYTVQIVNIQLVGKPKTKDFVLVDTGMPDSAEEIISVVESRFGSNSRPKNGFVTVKQEYLYKVLTQEKEISGPPRYLTTDWIAAKESVTKLRNLTPTVAVTGHGLPMSGELLTKSLEKLVEDFDEIAKPDYGKYVN